MGTLTLHDAPHISYERLERLGFTREDLEKIEAALPGTFEISFAFNPWALGEDLMRRLDITETEWLAAQLQSAAPPGLHQGPGR